MTFCHSVHCAKGKGRICVFFYTLHVYTAPNTMKVYVQRVNLYMTDGIVEQTVSEIVDCFHVLDRDVFRQKSLKIFQINIPQIYYDNLNFSLTTINQAIIFKKQRSGDFCELMGPVFFKNKSLLCLLHICKMYSAFIRYPAVLVD